MLLTIDDYKNHLPSNTIADANKFMAFESRAMFKYFRRYIGDALYADLLGDEPDADLLDKLKPALVNFTYLESIPFFNLVLTSTGYGVVSNQNVAPASMDRVRDLKDACLAAANDGLNSLLLYLEGSDNDKWNKCSLLNGSLIPDTNIFNSVTRLDISRVVFVDIIPHIRNHEALTLANHLSDEFTRELAISTDIKIKPLVQVSLAYLAYHHFTHQPVFNKQGNPVPQEPKWLELSDKYLKRAMAILNTNPDAYPTYKTYGYEAPYDNAGNDAISMFIGGLTS